ncbi:MAG TPA: PDR/VanB family oxidoreductase [Usitatibacter sp.]|nr:PDR/VanB family oxidoreductase [Usitatibacter sp.]
MTAPSPTLPVRVARAEQIAAGIHCFEFRRQGSGDLPQWTPGSHVSVRSPNGSVRKYSLCNDPAERDRYVIAVKRDPGGRGGSIDLVDNTRVGDAVEISAPHNAFDLAAKAQSFIFIAGGIGITPIMSMARALNADGRRYKLYYLTRSREHTAFADELSGDDFRGKVVIHHDSGNPHHALDLWPILEKPSAAHVYCCGPRPLLEAVRDMSGHWSRSAIHFESFIDAGAAAKPEDKAFAVVLARSGDRVDVPPGMSILEAMRARGHDAPSSCESGTCGTCRTTLVAGEADHRDLVLMDDEKATQIMICVSRALSPEIAIDR